LLNKLNLAFPFLPFRYNIESIDTKKDFLNSRTMFLDISLCVAQSIYTPYLFVKTTRANLAVSLIYI